MNKDIRVTVGLPDHHKTIKLVRKAGEGAFRCLLRLWCYAAEHRPHGVLSGMDATDIAIASGWDGDEAQWIDALSSTGWVDKSNGELTLHDWEEHNPYAFHAEARSAKARNAAKAKWEKRNAATGNATSINEHIGEKEEADRQARSSNAPSPSPSPSPSPYSSSLRSEPTDEREDNTGQGSAAKPKQQKGERLPRGATLPPDWEQWAVSEGHRNPQGEWLKFHDHWVAQPGQKGVKLDWEATWRNWVRRSLEMAGKPPRPPTGGHPPPRGSYVTKAFDDLDASLFARSRQ